MQEPRSPKSRFCDEFEAGVGWTFAELRQRTSHALKANGGVWLIDPLDAPGVEERVRALGEPRGVIQLLDRHRRDASPLASRLGVPHHAVPASLPASPFELIPIVRTPLWREVALWWRERRVLVCADALGTASYYRAPGETLAVYPWLRLTPPTQLARLEPLHVLCGHGEGVHGSAAAPALHAAIAGSRRRMPAAFLAGAARAVRRRAPR